MTLLSIAPLSPSSWAAIGAPLGNHLWQSTVFAGAVWLLTLLLRKNRAQSRYVLWLIASAKFLIPFSLLIGLGSHLSWSRTSAVTQPTVFLAMETLSEPFAPVNPTHVTPLSLSALQVAARFLPALLLMVRSVGCFTVLLVWYLRWRRLTAARRSALPLQSGREREALRRMEQTTLLPRQIDLLLSNSALEPGILGIFRPALLLPSGISEKLTDAQLESIIAHELCHVRRRDNLAAAFHMLVEAVFWFHPLVWWMGARLVEERERACDEEVLRLGANPHVYAESILKICKFYLESPQFCAAGVTGSNLKKRIEAIMMNRIARNLEWNKKLLLSTMGVAAIIGPVAFGLMSVRQVDARESEVTGPPPPAFQLASITPSRPRNEGTTVRFAPGRLTLANWTTGNLIGYAYNVNPPQKITGGPNWLDSQEYNIEVKVNDSLAYEKGNLIETNVAGRFPPGLRHEQLILLIRSLLADRFKLQLSRKTEQIPVYALVASKNGSKLQESKPGDTYGDGIIDPDGRPVGPHSGTGQKGHLTVQALPMANIVQLLSVQFGGGPDLVVDKTGLRGEYDFTLDWTPEDKQGAEPGPSIFTAIQEQLGLELIPQTVPVEMLVIDHAEKPSAEEPSQTQKQTQSSEKVQAANALTSPGGSLTCVFASARYPEGTVIQEGNGPEQLCARVLDRGKVNEKRPAAIHGRVDSY